MMTKLKRIAAHCKGSAHVNINDHRTNYWTVQQFLDDLSQTEREELPAEVVAGMLAADCVVQIIAYPRTAIGSYRVWHWNLEAAIDHILTELGLPLEVPEWTHKCGMAGGRQIVMPVPTESGDFGDKCACGERWSGP